MITRSLIARGNDLDGNWFVSSVKRQAFRLNRRPVTDQSALATISTFVLIFLDGPVILLQPEVELTVLYCPCRTTSAFC